MNNDKLLGMSQDDYYKLQSTGMFYELFPEASGNWGIDCMVEGIEEEDVVAFEQSITDLVETLTEGVEEDIEEQPLEAQLFELLGDALELLVDVDDHSKFVCECWKEARNEWVDRAVEVSS